MSLKQALTNSLLMFVAATCVVLIVRAVTPPSVASPVVNSEDMSRGAAAGALPTSAVADGVHVFYLHGNIRCPTCRSIEAYAKEAVVTGFSEQLRTGEVSWQVINYESPGHEHFATDYEVAAPTVVLAKFEGGTRIDWKGLPEVWEHVSDQRAFVDYVQRSLREFMGEDVSAQQTRSILQNPMRSSSNAAALSLPIPE